MLLYHFPLTSNSSSPNLTNKGLKQDYVLRNTAEFSNYGKISSYSLHTVANTNGLQIEIPQFTTAYSLCLRIFINSNQYLCEINGTQIVSSSIGITSTWCDIVLQDNKLYVNGAYKQDVTYSNGKLLIGGVFSVGGTCNCYIQDIRIYDYALSQAEINEYSRALVVHYTLQGNKLNPSVLKDVSGFGNDFEFPYLNYYGESVRAEKIAATKSSAWLQNSSRLYNTAKVVRAKTISFWAKRTSATVTTGSGVLASLYVAKQNGTNTSEYVLYIGLIKTGDIIRLQSQPSHQINLTTSYRFYTYVYTDDARFLIYVNGEKVKEFMNTVTYKDIYAGFCSYGWAGGINVEDAISLVDYRAYATALSAEDIKNLYNSPISVSKQHQTMAFEFKENPLYQSKYWRTPTYAEMNYVLNTRTNAANLRTLGRVEISSGVYHNGLFLLPDGFVAPSGITVTITTAGFAPNTYSLNQLKQLESVGVVFIACNGFRNGTEAYDQDNVVRYYLGTNVSSTTAYQLAALPNTIECNIQGKAIGRAVRLIHNGTHFSTSATTKIDFAPANLQYHCTQHIWRFAEHSYDIIGADNANISDYYNGWIDLFGYGTSGVNYSPTLHTTTNADYAQGDIANTDNDWGINEIQSYDYNVKNFAANKNGIVQHNELRENDSEVNGCYNNKLITNELIEN